MIRNQQPHLHDYIQVIIQRRWIVLAFFVTLVTTVLIGALKETPIYRAIATIMIEHQGPRVVSVQEVVQTGPAEYGTYKDYYETQYKLIKNPTLLKKIANSLGINSPKKGITPAELLMKAVNVVPIRSSQLVEIHAEDSNPEMAAKIANTLAEEFINQNLERNIKTASEAGVWLSKKIVEQRQILKDAETALQKYREEHKINILPQVTDKDIAIEDIMSEYAKLQALYANYTERYTDLHPKMMELKAQIASLKNKIEGLGGVDTGEMTAEYRTLERGVQTNNYMYEALVKRLKEIDLSGNLSFSNISITNRAEIPGKPVKPNIMLNIILAVMVGLVGGIGLAFFVDYLDITIKSPDDVKDLLGSTFLGAISEVTGANEENKHAITYFEPKSPVTESYRAIRTILCHLMSQGENLKTILITSASPQAGKTLTITNLSIVFAQKESKVLLVDTDLRKPQIHKMFNLDKNIGLSEYLLDGRDLDSIIKKTEIEGLKVITCGKTVHNPAEIIASSKTKEFIAEAKDKFDFIFFDSSPLISVTDADILADILDVSIQVVRSGKTLAPIALRAKEKLLQAKAKNLGVILNDMKACYDRYYYYGYYRYYAEEDKEKGSKEKEESEDSITLSKLLKET